MKGICLKFYTYELQKHQGVLLFEWLLEFAKKNGIRGGSAFRALAGFGRHGVMHAEHFFELASLFTVLHSAELWSPPQITQTERSLQ